MARIQPKKSNKLINIIIIIALTICLYFVVAYFNSFWPFRKIKENNGVSTTNQPQTSTPSEPATDDTKDAKDKEFKQEGSQSSQIIETEKERDPENKTAFDESKTYTPSLSIANQGWLPGEEPELYELSVSINRISQTDASCKIYINNNSISTVGVQNLPSSSVCKGFLLNKNQVKTGDKYKITFESGNIKDKLEGVIK